MVLLNARVYPQRVYSNSVLIAECSLVRFNQDKLKPVIDMVVRSVYHLPRLCMHVNKLSQQTRVSVVINPRAQLFKSVCRRKK